MKPNLFIVGAPKSGTTYLYELLRRHPEVYMSPVKEPHYFGKDLRFRKHPYPRTVQFYERLFQNVPRGKKYAGEASVWTLYSRRAPKEIVEYRGSTDVKIIIMLRNPFDFALALYHQLLWNGEEDAPSFEHALKMEDTRKKNPPEKINLPRSVLYTENARYYPYVKRWISVFGQENVRVIIFEEFFSDYTSQVADLAQWLGIAPEALIEIRIGKVNTRKLPRKSLQRWLHDPPAIARRVWRMIPDRIRIPLAHVVVPKVFARSPGPLEKHPSRWAVSWILERVDQDIQRLESLLNKELKQKWIAPFLS